MNFRSRAFLIHVVVEGKANGLMTTRMPSRSAGTALPRGIFQGTVFKLPRFMECGGNELYHIFGFFHSNTLVEKAGIETYLSYLPRSICVFPLPLSMSSPQQHRPTSPRRRHNPLTNTQLLSQAMERQHFKNFQWIPSECVDKTGRVWHLATFNLCGQPLDTPKTWQTTAKAAREDTAFYALPIVTAAMQQLEFQARTASSMYPHH
ncbi:hypothetical protein M408DRAFT_100678 [Serendipita vermifera MAFF 305830]|uniref:Uncharacterized protein n=1 Tax=Serendipita vermifera MAFF 305830 TaxID=933852 RepID=A0A0C2XM73_SERVB|nr:hypothetical protein M408DRAFT_100678 [Serendipita vermifera MAFF 305830]